MVAGANVFAVGKTNERCDGRRVCFAEEIADGDLARRVQSAENFLKSIKDIRVVEIAIKRPCGSSRLKSRAQDEIRRWIGLPAAPSKSVNGFRYIDQERESVR